jgi:hypothetical protein
MPLLIWLAWLSNAVTDTAGSFFSTSRSSIMGLFRPVSLAAFLRRKRAGRSAQYAVIVIRARSTATPPTAMTATTEEERGPIDAVMVIDKYDLQSELRALFYLAGPKQAIVLPKVTRRGVDAPVW